MNDRPWLPQIYNLEVTERPGIGRYRKAVLVWARQCEKSSTVGYKLLTAAAMIPFLRSLYVNPSTIQIREFSDERLKLPMAESPMFSWLTTYSNGNMIPQNVSTKWMRNGAKISLRPCFISPDRIRGLSVDDLNVDEFQDILTRNLGVIEETQFACKLPEGPTSTYAGTPKGFDTPLEKYWSNRSTQCEWMTRCSHCNYWNVFDRENLGKTGLVCGKCRKDVDPVSDPSQWVAHGPIDSQFAGFRLPQPVVIYAYRRKYPRLFKLKWADQLYKDKHEESPAVLMNEVWARSYDSGSKPVTRRQLQKCCNPEFEGPYTENILSRLASTPMTWAGVDWGGGRSSTTCLTIWRYQRHSLQQAYHRRYVGFEADEEFVINHIIQTCKQAKVNRIGADYGFGYGMNSQLRRAFPGKVIVYMHMGKMSPPVQADEDKLKCHRTQVMTWYFELIKRGMVQFPRWDIFQKDLLSDFECISLDESRSTREMIYNHPPGTKDDFFHSGLYAILASMFDVPRPDLVAPDTTGKGWVPETY